MSHNADGIDPVGGDAADSTPEAEVVAIAKGFTRTGVPILELMETTCRRKIKFTVHEDNDPARRVIDNGYSIALRHMKRLQGVSLSRLHGRFHGDLKLADLVRCDTTDMRADGFTKTFPTASSWLHVRDLMCMRAAGSGAFNALTQRAEALASAAQGSAAAS